MPSMGMSDKISNQPQYTSLADALFTKTQQRVLAYLFGQPERSFFATELIRLAGSGSGAVQRELARLERSGLVTVSRVCNQKPFQVNPDSPLAEELCGIVRKTVGLAEPLREALAPLADRIDAAFVFGSVAKKQDGAASDIDLMVISDVLSYADLFGALEAATVKLGRTVNPAVYSRKEVEQRISEENAFFVRVMEQPKIWVIGQESDITIGKPERTG